MSDLQKLLAELSEIVPQICRRVNDEYIMQGFVFFVDKKVGLTATLFESNGTTSGSAIGNPAYDWLQGALMRVIEGKGWDFRNQKAQGVYLVQLWKSSGHTVPMADSRSFDSLVEALLTALIQALKDNN